MKPPFLHATLLLLCVYQVRCKPFYWGDDSFLTTQQPLLQKAFSKLNHWFRNLIDAYPSSTWYWKEHIYGRTYWKNPKLIRGWLSISEGPLGFNYRERHLGRTDLYPLGHPGFTRPKWNPDYIDDNILSLPNTQELEKLEAREKKQKQRLGSQLSGSDLEEASCKSEDKKRGEGARNIRRGADDENY